MTRQTPPERRRFGVHILEPVIILIAISIVFLFTMERIENNALGKNGGGKSKNTKQQKTTVFLPPGFKDFNTYMNLAEELKIKTNLVMIVESAYPTYYRRCTLSSVNEYGCFFDADMDESTQPWELRSPGWKNPVVRRSAYRSNMMQNYYFVGNDFNEFATMAADEPYRMIHLQVPEEETNITTALRTYSYTVYPDDIQFNSNTYCIRIQPEYSNIQLSSKHFSYYTKTPRNSRLAVLADEIISNYRQKYYQLPHSPFYQAAFIEHYLRNNYYYTLKPGAAPNGKPLEYFLFERKAAFCSYFAQAMVLLCRYRNIPARVAIGFPPVGDDLTYSISLDDASPSTHPLAESATVLNYYFMYAVFAHAWVEVFINGIGWVTFDPTTWRQEPGENAFEEFNPVPPRDLLGDILTIPFKPQPFEEEHMPEVSPVRRFVRQTIRILRQWWWLIILCSIIGYYGYRKIIPYGLLYCEKNDRRYCIQLYFIIIRELAALGIRRTSGETFIEFSERIERTTPYSLQQLTDIYIQAEYRSRVESSARSRAAAAAHAVRKSFTVWQRIQIIFSPRTLS